MARRWRQRLRFAVTVAAAVLVALLLAACAKVGPNYVPPPEPSNATQWHGEAADGLTTSTPDPKTLAVWWTEFKDPTLTGLIEDAIQNNLDLKKADSRLRQARAQRAISGAGLFPTLGLSGSATRTWTRTESEAAGTQTSHGDLYRAGFDATWEADVFGGLRRSIEAAEGDLQAQQMSLYDTLVSLTAEVALEYAGLRITQNRIALAEDNLRLQKETLDLVEWRYQARLIDELPVQQARSSYESTSAQIPTLRASLDASLNRLAVLLGQAPGALHDRLSTPGPIPNLPDSVSIGAPSEMLRRRPDIREAERKLAAQTARIGVAVADLYPKFYVTGSVSRQGAGTEDFLKNPTQSLSLGPSFSWNIFSAGAVQKKVELQKEIKEEYLIAYQSAILSAIEESANKMYALGQERVRGEKLGAAIEAAKSVVQLSKDQYKSGRVDFSEVVSAEQSLLTLQDQMAQSKGAMATDMISLFKALGGGWDPAAVAAANTASAAGGKSELADTKPGMQHNEQ